MPCASAATAELDEFPRGELLRRRLVSEFQFRHASFLLLLPKLASWQQRWTPITDRVHFAYTDLVNWTLVTDGDGVILIDTGFPGNRDDVLDSLRQLGFGVDDLRAILLTHAHIDHFGSAIWFAKTHGTPVYCHAAEVGHAKREYLEQASPVDIAKHIWQPRYLKWSVAITRKGGMTHDGIPTTQALTEDVAARLPGAPMAIPTPGHTGGHCSFLVDGVLVSRRRPGHRPPAGIAHRPAAAAEAVQPRPGRLPAQPGRARAAGHRGSASRSRPGVAGFDPGGQRASRAERQAARNQASVL